MPYGKLITRFTTGGLSVHAFCGTGDENIIPTCREAGNYYIVSLVVLKTFNGKANHKKFSVCCHPTDPEKLPLPQNIYWSSCKKIFFFYFIFSGSVFQFLLYFPSKMLIVL